MKKVMKESVLKAIASVGKKSAKIGSNSASIFGFHQPKEPANFKETLRAEKK